jgi:2-haloacid dehalogenase
MAPGKRANAVTRFDLVAFDLYGTLLDISKLVSRMEPLVQSGAANLLARWRKAQLERTWRLNREGRYERWDHVTTAALAEVAPELSQATREHLSELWLALPAYPDAAATLAALRAAGARRAILSNGTRAMIAKALEENSLVVDHILSADDVRVYKTHPKVYALLDKQAVRDRTLFVSSNGWDADGARREARITAWIDRGGDPPQIPPAYCVASLSEIPGLL